MADKDLLKQNRGPHQGNLHIDADEGRNEGKHGSTLDKSRQSEKGTDRNDDDNHTGDNDIPLDDDTQEADTLGNP